MRKTLVIIPLLLVMFAFLPAFAFGSPLFSDLPSDHWAYSEIMELVENGIVEGFPDGTFGPSKSLTREQFATMLARAMELKIEGKESDKPPYFRDMPTDYWASPYVEAVKDYFVTYETKDGIAFRGKGLATREIVTSALVKAKAYEGENQIDLLEKHFSDEDKIEKNLRGDVSLAVQNDLINGFPDGTFRPKDGLKREQAAVLISRAFYDLDLNKIDFSALPSLKQSAKEHGKLREELNNKYGRMVISESGEARAFDFTFNVVTVDLEGKNTATYVYMNLGMGEEQDQYFKFLPVFKNNKDSVLSFMGDIAQEAGKGVGQKNVIVNMGFYRSYLFNVAGIFGDSLVTYNTDLKIYEVEQLFVSILYDGDTVKKNYLNKISVSMDTGNR